MSTALALDRTITYQFENNFDQAVAATRYMWTAHWDEIASHKDVRHFSPRLGVRRLLMEKGMFVVATARQSGRVIGYISWVVVGDPQVQEQITAETDVYYVEPRPHRALIMLQLMRLSVDELERRGIVVARSRTKTKTDGPGRGAGLLWERLGFRPLEIIYTKPLRPPGQE
jgi:GNAT superfamily N-acetyltransferase